MERLLKYFDEKRQLINTALNLYLPRIESQPTVLHEAMRYAMLGGGKRIRPLLTLLTCELFHTDTVTALPAACAIEMVHTYSLVHDDLPAMDNDDLRRGRLTCHKAYNEATAILAGDALLTLAFELLAQHYSGSIATESIKILTSAAGHRGMINGQFYDMDGEKRRLTVPEIEQMYYLKTAMLLIAAGKIGALVAGATESQIAAVADYAKEIGLLFQITDDILDETGSVKELGKNIKQDSSAGKSTVVAARGIADARAEAEIHAKCAITALVNFGPEALLLRLLPSYLLTRVS